MQNAIVLNLTTLHSQIPTLAIIGINGAAFDTIITKYFVLYFNNDLIKILSLFPQILKAKHN